MLKKVKCEVKDIVSLKGQGMIVRDPGERGENFKVDIIDIRVKSLLSTQSFTGSSMVLLSSFWVAYFGKRIIIRKFYVRRFSNLLDDMKAIFEPISLNFGIYTYIYSSNKHFHFHLHFRRKPFETLDQTSVNR